MFVLAALCAVVAIKPRATWRALTRWQFKDPARAELTGPAYVARAVLAGLCALLLAINGIQFLAREDGRRCEHVLSVLEDAAAGVDFDRSTVEEIGDDLSARFDLDLAAAGLAVELEEHGDSVDVVTEDGDVLGTIDESGVDSRCD
jgi:hypothetical protein